MTKELNTLHKALKKAHKRKAFSNWEEVVDAFVKTVELVDNIKEDKNVRDTNTRDHIR